MQEAYIIIAVAFKECLLHNLKSLAWFQCGTLNLFLPKQYNIFSPLALDMAFVYIHVAKLEWTIESEGKFMKHKAV